MGNVNCLVGCAQSGNVNTIDSYLPEAHILSPFASVKFTTGDDSITVGNQSSPKLGNSAAIKSMEYGCLDGTQLTVEIVDERGGEFQVFIDKLSKCLGNSSKDYKMIANFGWTITNCEGGSQPPIKSNDIYFLPIKIDVQFNSEEGKVYFTITGADLMNHVFVSKEKTNFGSDDMPMDLKKAIGELFSKNEPKIKVEFLRRNPDGTTSTCNFKGEPDGPKGTRQSDNKNKLQILWEWIVPQLTDKNKGLIAIWNPENPEPTLVILENPMPGCDDSSGTSKFGTFIVNAGKCSNVISFNPSISWAGPLAILATGGATGGQSSGTTVQTVKPCTDNPKDKSFQSPPTGATTNLAENSNWWNMYSPSNIVSTIQKSISEYMNAQHVINRFAGTITADLTIVGNPDRLYTNPVLLAGASASVVVINPFTIVGSGCGDWLAQPLCNSVLTNKNWLVQGAHHSIKDGKYLTTLKLMLVAPDIDTKNTELGGSGGYKPPGLCN